MKLANTTIRGRVTRTVSTCLGAAFVLAAFGAPAWAQAPSGGAPLDVEGDEEQAEKEWKKAEEGQGKEGEGGALQGMENPLEEILKLMEEVEGRLFEADTGDFTQDEQKKIVEAMRFEDQTHTSLQKLIEEVERQQQQQQQKMQQSGQEQQKQQKKPETEQQRKEREQKERERKQKEKELERQRQMQKQQQQQKQDVNQKEPQKQQESKLNQDSQGELGPGGGAAGSWGRLPAKLHQDAKNASNQPPPSRWSDLIKEYRIRISDAED